MGYDKTPSRDKMILGMGVLCIATLIALMPILRMYFFSVMTPLERENAARAGLEQRAQYERDQQAALANVAGAVQTFGQGGRDSSPLVSPRSGEAANVDAVEGWSQMKNEAAARAARAAFEAARAREAAQAAAALVDGGVAPAPAPAPNGAP